MGRVERRGSGIGKVGIKTNWGRVGNTKLEVSQGMAALRLTRILPIVKCVGEGFDRASHVKEVELVLQGDEHLNGLVANCRSLVCTHLDDIERFELEKLVWMGLALIVRSQEMVVMMMMMKRGSERGRRGGRQRTYKAPEDGKELPKWRGRGSEAPVERNTYL